MCGFFTFRLGELIDAFLDISKDIFSFSCNLVRFRQQTTLLGLGKDDGLKSTSYFDIKRDTESDNHKNLSCLKLKLGDTQCEQKNMN